MSDPMQCAEMHIATRAHLAEQGYAVASGFNLTLVRNDGEAFASVCDSPDAVRHLIDVLGPPKIYLMVGDREDHGAMLAELTPPVLH